MKFRNEPVFGFTKKWDGRVNVLTSEVFVSQAFDPERTPIHPQETEFKGIWDTGASASVITARVVKELNLVPTGRVDVYTANGPANVNTYLVNIKIPPKVNFIGLRVTEGIISGDVDLLIGMDIIGQGDLAVTNHDGKTYMSFRVPSVEHIDFVAEINRYNTKYERVFMTEDEKRRARNKSKAERRKSRK